MLFIYDTAHTDELRDEIAKADACRGIVTHGMSGHNFRSAVRMLLNHDKLIVPTAIPHCTPLVERMRGIALNCNIDVVNLTAYLSQVKYQPKRSMPAAAVAVPTPQQPAVAGQSTVSR